MPDPAFVVDASVVVRWMVDMAYAALAEQAGTAMWTIDERFYNGARAQRLAHVMHPGRDPLP
ncbi:MAG TPA: hypothetical protein VKF37_15225 [Chloroflexota bacterium]|nr:hypothetical protein [Chloroflexota bacterium]